MKIEAREKACPRETSFVWRRGLIDLRQPDRTRDIHDPPAAGESERPMLRTGPRSVVPAVLVGLALSRLAAAQSDPLPSWNDGPAKQAITRFVADTTKEGSPKFVPPAERIAVFDNDGTLWAEQPLYFQFLFGIDRVKVMAPQHPEWKTTEPYKSVLEGQVEKALAQGDKAILEIMMISHAGMTTEEFDKTVRAWLETARHPRFHRPYTEIVYQPMVELLGYMRASGFKTFIVSGGGVEFMRAFADKVYGIPPEQVVGSAGETKFQLGQNGPVLMKLPKVEFIDDGPGKPEGIQRIIGRRPVFAFGNSDGDQQMLEWTAAGQGAPFMGLVHHTDAEREWAYDRASHIGKLDKAWDEATAKGWTVVDMKKDWKKVFAFEK
jgi:phosphoglycolate phosphatase-like HAD superfamily hydrolase